jgi:hypothetical protein
LHQPLSTFLVELATAHQRLTILLSLSALTAAAAAAAKPHLLNWQLVNLAQLEVVSLMRYRRVFQLGGVGPAAATREELLHAVSRHFAEQVRGVWVNSSSSSSS